MIDRERAKAMLDALEGLGLAAPLRDQFEVMIDTNDPNAIPLMRQLIDAEPTVIRKLNAAGLALSEV